MTDELRVAVTTAADAACREFMCKLGEKRPWLHPDYDPKSWLWRERAKLAWKALGRKPTYY